MPTDFRETTYLDLIVQCPDLEKTPKVCFKFVMRVLFRDYRNILKINGVASHAENGIVECKAILKKIAFCYLRDLTNLVQEIYNYSLADPSPYIKAILSNFLIFKSALSNVSMKLFLSKYYFFELETMDFLSDFENTFDTLVIKNQFYIQNAIKHFLKDYKFCGGKLARFREIMLQKIMLHFSDFKSLLNDFYFYNNASECKKFYKGFCRYPWQLEMYMSEREEKKDSAYFAIMANYLMVNSGATNEEEKDNLINYYFDLPKDDFIIIFNDIFYKTFCMPTPVSKNTQEMCEQYAKNAIRTLLNCRKRNNAPIEKSKEILFSEWRDLKYYIDSQYTEDLNAGKKLKFTDVHFLIANSEAYENQKFLLIEYYQKTTDAEFARLINESENDLLATKHFIKKPKNEFYIIFPDEEEIFLSQNIQVSENLEVISIAKSIIHKCGYENGACNCVMLAENEHLFDK